MNITEFVSCLINSNDSCGTSSLQAFYIIRLYTETSRRTFFRACVFTIFLPHLWNGFIFFYGIYNVFLVPCIVLVSEMLSFTVVTKFNDILICKLHRFVLYGVVSKASRGSLLQQWFIRFLVFFQSNVFRKHVWIECSMYRSSPFRSTWNTGYITGLDMCPVCTEAVHSVALGTRVTLQVLGHVSSIYRSSPFRSTWNTGYITGLDMCPVCTEAVHSVALGTRVTLQVWTCVQYVPKQSIP